MERNWKTPLGRLNPLDWRFKTLFRFIIPIICVSVILYPQIITVLLLSNLLGCLALYYLRFRVLPRASSPRNLCLIKGVQNNANALISVHLPVFAGEEDLALKTMKSLERQNHPNYEIIVYRFGKVSLGDDPKCEKTLRGFCKKRARFKFKYQTMDLKNFTGSLTDALNECFKEKSVRAQFCLALRPGWELLDHALSKVSEFIQTKNFDYLGLPKTSIIQNKGGSPIFMEKDHSSGSYMHAGAKERALIIGNYPILVKTRALEKLGGWTKHGDTITATSLRLLTNGFRGTFCRGLCISSAKDPSLSRLSLSRLKRSRAHKSFVHLNLLLSMRPRDFLRMDLKESKTIFAQLTSHQEFLFAPGLYFLLKGIQLTSNHFILPNLSGASAIAGTTILLSLYLKLSLVHQKSAKELQSANLLKIYSVNLALSLAPILNWPKALLGVAPNRKSNRKSRDRNVLEVLPHILLAIIASALSYGLYNASENVAVITPFLTGVIMLAGVLVILREISKSRSDQSFQAFIDKEIKNA